MLLAAYDIAARGPLAEMAPSALPFAAAFVLSATKTDRTLAELVLRRASGRALSDDVPASLAPLATNPMGAQALPLLVALARRTAREVVVASGRDTLLAIEVTP